MSSVFGSDYADAYDALYHDKDYAAECAVIRALFTRYGQGTVETVLDLGCGSGNHVVPLAMAGFTVAGVDRSAAMLAHARRKAELTQVSDRVKFIEGDIRTCRLDRTFDAALMLFAVLGYQVEDVDLSAALATARSHLKPGGFFVFDCWYGPAVIAERPSDRVKTVGTLTRYTTSTLDVASHRCEVNFRLDDGGKVSEEIHAVRFFFPRELDLFLERAGFTLLRLGQFPNIDSDPDATTWNVLGVARAAP